ncbi:hypothetical protein [Rufibacter psychrotolerans]|uniref:hypothetical protein n=1 Tax=Rufibacter psychrotolerans TaxID=2812556 RepID=UPI0019682B23|nr:hypothetical protein [Rufibacter sp. SYSU D00308]
MPALDKELRKAILALPAARKDKLLLQLLTPNQLLQEQLAFELLEGPDGLETRREALHAHIQAVAQGFYYNASELLIALRALCPLLNNHAKVTADAYGGVSLLLLLLKEVLLYQQDLVRDLTGATEPLGVFLAKQTQEALQKLQKLHEDLHVEFADDLNQVLPKLHASAAGYTARKLGVPVRWE